MINKLKTCIFILTIVLATNFSQAQVATLTPEVIASNGGHDTLNMGSIGSISVSYTVGECITTTISPAPGPFTVHTLTQGFHQPGNSANTLSINMIPNNSTCIGANNGSIMLLPVTSTGPVTFSFNAGPFTSQGLYQNLSPGTYYYEAMDGTFTITDSVVISEDAVDCGAYLVFYQGFTPNGDNVNDTWVIDGIENYDESSVSIFNRWGNLVWQSAKYNNLDFVWDGTSKGQPVPDATYFYIVEVGGQTYKGWVEVTH
jgi:gliding motility-associated-like protein